MFKQTTTAMAKLFNQLKHKLQPCDNPQVMDFLYFPLEALRITGVNLIDNRAPRSFKEKCFRKTETIRVLLTLVIIIFVIILHVVYIYKNLKAFPVEAVRYFLMAFVIFVNYVDILCKKSEIISIIKELKAFYPGLRIEQKKYKVGNYFVKIHRFNIINLIFWSCFLLVQIIGPIITFISTGVWFREDFVDSSFYPFDVHHYFTFVYLWHIVKYACLTLSLFSQLGIYCATIELMAINFRVLEVDFKDLKNFYGTDKKEQLITLIKRHQRLMNLSARVCSLHSVSNAMHYCSHSIILCILSYTTKHAINDSICDVIVTNIFQLITACSIMSLQYNQAQKMIDGSESIAYAAYDSGWEEVADKDYRSMLRLVMLRAQRPVKMRAFGFIVISLEAVVFVSFVD